MPRSASCSGSRSVRIRPTCQRRSCAPARPVRRACSWSTSAGFTECGRTRPVVSARGLVGRDPGRTPAHRRGIDWTSPDFRVSAMLEDGTTFGIVENVRGASREQDRLRLNGIAYHETCRRESSCSRAGSGRLPPRHPDRHRRGARRDAGGVAEELLAATGRAAGLGHACARRDRGWAGRPAGSLDRRFPDGGLRRLGGGGRIGRPPGARRAASGPPAVSGARAWGTWILVAALVFVHFLLHVGLGYGRGAPDLLTVALLLAAREVRVGTAAAVGLLFGLLEDALSVLAFGANAVAMTAIGILGALTRDLFVGDSRLFAVSYFFVGEVDARLHPLGHGRGPASPTIRRSGSRPGGRRQRVCAVVVGLVVVTLVPRPGEV
jgi:hypothetical protein